MGRWAWLCVVWTACGGGTTPKDTGDSAGGPTLDTGLPGDSGATDSGHSGAIDTGATDTGAPPIDTAPPTDTAGQDLPDSIEDCEERLRQCLNAGGDPVVCGQEYEQCLDLLPDDTAVDSADTGGGCEQQYDACVASGQPVEVCDQVLQDCLNPPEPGPCELAFDACLAAGTDPLVCRAEYEACLTDTADTGA